MNSFAKRISELMQEKGISQNQLAVFLKVKQQTVSRYMNGEREPDIDSIIKIAKFFGVSADYLLGLED